MNRIEKGFTISLPNNQQSYNDAMPEQKPAYQVYQEYLRDQTVRVSSLIESYIYRQHQRAVNGYYLMWGVIV